MCVCVCMSLSVCVCVCERECVCVVCVCVCEWASVNQHTKIAYKFVVKLYCYQILDSILFLASLI